MKKIICSVVAAVMVMTVTLVQAQEKIIEFSQLPKLAQDFITMYYDRDDVSYIQQDAEFLRGKTYEVHLVDGKEIEFDSKGKWTEVNAQKDAVPSDIIPAAIREHVHKSFPNNTIVEIKQSSRKYEVELSSGLDLEFDTKGNFLRIDD